MNPSDFIKRPYNSVFQNSESEVVARNIMMILKEKGDVWCDLSWDEYKETRLKHGRFSEKEKPYFEKVLKFCRSENTARTFSPAWNPEN